MTHIQTDDHNGSTPSGSLGTRHWMIIYGSCLDELYRRNFLFQTLRVRAIVFTISPDLT